MINRLAVTVLSLFLRNGVVSFFGHKLLQIFFHEIRSLSFIDAHIKLLYYIKPKERVILFTRVLEKFFSVLTLGLLNSYFFVASDSVKFDFYFF